MRDSITLQMRDGHIYGNVTRSDMVMVQKMMADGIRMQLDSFAMVVDRLKDVSGIEKRFNDQVTAGGGGQETLLTARRAAKILLSPDYRLAGWNYYTQSLEISERTESLRSFHKLATRSLGILISQDDEQKRIFGLMESSVNLAEQENPIYKGRYTRDFFWRLAAEGQPISSALMQDLDSIYEETNDPEDVAMMVFLQHSDVAGTTLTLGGGVGRVVYSKDTGAGRVTWRDNRGRGVDSNLTTNYNGLVSTVRGYFGYYRDRCLQRKLWNGAFNGGAVFPEKSLMLPVAVAVSFANHTDLFPSTFNDLVDNNLFPGLGDEAAVAIKDHYRTVFFERHADVLARRDNQGRNPYRLAEESWENGDRLEVWRGLVHNYNLEPDIEAGDIEQLYVLSSRNAFRHFRNRLQSGVHAVSIGNGVLVDVSAYGEQKVDLQRTDQIQPSVDLTIIDAQGRAAMVQILPGKVLGGAKDPGFVMGVPEEYQEVAKPVLADILTRAKQQVEGGAFVNKKEPLPQPPKGKASPTQSVSGKAVLPLKTRAQRMAEYEARQANVLKRKQLATQVVTRDGEKETTAQEARVDQRQFALEVVESPLFLEHLGKLPEDMRVRVVEAIERAEHEEKMIKPLLADELKPGSPKLFSIRVGDWRIKLVHLEKGKMLATGVLPRGIVYEKFEEDVRELKRFVAARH